LLSNNTISATNTKLNISDTASMLSNRFARDTANLSARIDNLASNSGIATSAKLNISDTAAMLSNRITRDTANLSARIDLLSSTTTTASNTKLNISDTAAMLSNRIQRDTVNLSLRINNLASSTTSSIATKLNLSDTAAMLSNRIQRDTANLSTRIDLLSSSTASANSTKLNISDTATMLSSRFSRDTISLSSRIDTKLSKTDTTALLAAYAKKFTKNVPVKLAPGKYLGKYINGDTIPAKGKTMDEFLEDIAIEIVHPNYTLPSVVLNFPRDTVYEIGANLNFNFSSSFTRNDAGAATSSVYQNNGTVLGGTSFSAALTSNAKFKVVVNYAAGTAKNNNQGVSDTTGQIGSGSVTSNEVQVSVLPKAYWGYSSSSNPSDATIIGGSSALASSKAKDGFSITVPSGNSQYVFYAYPTSYGDLDALYVGGFESKDAFTLVKRNVTNANNYTQSYNIYISNNTLSDIINDIKAK